MNPTIIVSAAMILQDGRLLVSQRKNGLWEFPGGKIEAGEDPRKTAERELKEELDLSVKAGPIFEVIYHDYPDISVIMMLFLCELTGEYAPRLLDGPVDVKWTALPDIQSEEFLAADKPLMEYLRDHSQQVLEKADMLWAGYRQQEER